MQGQKQRRIPLMLSLTHKRNRTSERAFRRNLQRKVGDYTVWSDYYDWNLERRKVFLRASSVDQLCKTIVMENTRCINMDCLDPSNSKYYAILVQYSTKIHPQKILKLVKSWNPGVSGQYFNFQLAPSEVNETLTGFSHNAVVPIGMRTSVPLIVSGRILQVDPPFVWMGGGDVYVKLLLSVDDILRILQPKVGDICY
mmetsp:Transcript_963/g.1479  ORF Transcript_963/g.1479 Transcript_963/m.1479 type:complete len:198 (+) Transcript_963:142-735(+)